MQTEVEIMNPYACKSTRIISEKRYNLLKMFTKYANIVQTVKSCYKIKINYRESKSCFYGVLLCKQHPRITIAPLLHYNSATIRV